MTNVAAGRLRHVVAIERQVEVVDSNGDHSRDWEYVTSKRCEIKSLSGRDLLIAQQVQSNVSVMVVMRYTTDVDATCRLKKGGVIYSIAAVITDPESMREWISLPCSVGLNDG